MEVQAIIQHKDLKLMRIAANEEIENVARYVGKKSKKTISNWEEGKGSPDINQFITLSHKLGFCPYTLIELCIERAQSKKPFDIKRAMVAR